MAPAVEPLKVAVWWEYLSTYMSATWRALADRRDVDLFVIAKETTLRETNAAFSVDLLDGVAGAILPPQEAMDAATVGRLLEGFAPDVLVIAGWTNPALEPVLRSPSLSGVPVVLAMDTPLIDPPWRRAAVRWKRRSLYRRCDQAFVPGERSRVSARSLGFPMDRISTGLYGTDVHALAAAGDARTRRPWPDRFLFVGRLVPEKGVETLLEAYARHRDECPTPWGLTVCGAGPLAEAVRRAPGVDYRGFVGPDALLELLGSHGALVLPSWYDPWPIVVLEAAAAGLPIVATTESGSTVELLRDLHNGRTVPARDAEALSDAMTWIASRRDDLDTLGLRSRELASPYSSAVVSTKWESVCRQVLHRRRSTTG